MQLKKYAIRVQSIDTGREGLLIDLAYSLKDQDRDARPEEEYVALVIWRDTRKFEDVKLSGLIVNDSTISALFGE